ncbi:MAG: hypothetical protein PHQ22_10125 [Sulfuricurvum sp.]|nr:hypothetical protein [Sulfuricurvum sp.]MDD5387536.1 hypothetical protein [Sulfuricurvum sp.]
MKVVAGKESLSIVLETAKKLFAIYFSDQNNGKSNILPQVYEGFFKTILDKPIIFYCEIGALNGSHHSGEFKNYVSSIHYAESLETLWFLYNLPGPEQEKIEINWVIIEAKKTVNHADLLQKVVFIDHWQESYGKKNTTGRIDFQRLEITIKNNVPKNFGKNIMKKFIKFISYPLLGVKPPQMAYIYPKIQYIDSPRAIKINSEMNKNIYRYKCIVCGMLHSVVLSQAINKKIPSSNTMIKYDTVKQSIEFVCGHSNTSYQGRQNVYFKLDNVGGYKLNTPESYDQAFLFIFYTYQRDKDNIVYLDQNFNRIVIPIEEYLGLDESRSI